MRLSNKAYNFLKWFCLIALPAAGAFYFGLAKIWGFPYGTEIVGTLDLIATFLGALIGISCKAYKQEEETHGEEV